ncbi:MAG: peptidoglycan-associated lipoprotein Pal [Candidatus Aureabacteria bacterium]|nr:peptidoglycan-associated lipoprotein Pal [Candidatus Auribacterota bacterium]
MKIFKMFAILLACSVVFTGCKKSAKKDATATDATLGYKDIPLTEISLENFEEPSEELAFIFRSIHFDYNKYNIKSSDASILNDIAGWMRENPSKLLLIEGHCDERGSNEYNLALGEQRSLSVRRYLISLGLDPARLHTVSYGEERPIAFSQNEESWNKNRRAEFLISK